MRVPRAWVTIMAKEVAAALTTKGLVVPLIAGEDFLLRLEEIILNELMAEDRLNEEVRQLLKSYETEIERGRLDYRDLFEMTKRKLLKERNIVL